jgi:hypothetical protein
VLLAFGWFLSGGDAPDYTATDEVWAAWAGDNRSGSGVGAFLILLAGFALLHFAGTIRNVLGSAETTVRGSVQLARVAFAGAIVGAAGIATAIVIVASATSEGADADPIVTRAVASTSAGPYLVAAMGFAALLGAAGLSARHPGARDLVDRYEHRQLPRRGEHCPRGRCEKGRCVDHHRKTR